MSNHAWIVAPGWLRVSSRRPFLPPFDPRIDIKNLRGQSFKNPQRDHFLLLLRVLDGERAKSGKRNARGTELTHPQSSSTLPYELPGFKASAKTTTTTTTTTTTKLPRIFTFNSQLDKTLGGNGLPLASVTELVGPPGTGKRALCLRLCVNAALKGGLGGLKLCR